MAPTTSGFRQHLSVVMCGVAARIWSVSHPCISSASPDASKYLAPSLSLQHRESRGLRSDPYNHEINSLAHITPGLEVTATHLLPSSLFRFLYENECPPLARVSSISVRELLTLKYFLLGAHVSFGNRATFRITDKTDGTH